MEATMIDFAAARMNMVDNQLRPNGITDGRIISAMLATARENYVPEAVRSVAYLDGNLPLAGALTPRSLIEPMAFAKMVQAAAITSTDSVLEIGSATGFGAEILASMAAKVVAVESDSTLIAAARTNLNGKVNVSLSERGLAEGCPEQGPYNVILISGRVAEVPKALFSQLSEGGRLVAVVAAGPVGTCTIWTKSGENYTQRGLFALSVAPLPGFGKPAAGFAF
jgi:protein-L-isoaspartate(D-aspartate) O-methyltransferase